MKRDPDGGQASDQEAGKDVKFFSLSLITGEVVMVQHLK